MVGVTVVMATSLKRAHTSTPVRRSSQHPGARGRPLLTHTCAGDSWTLTGKSGSVSCGVAAPFSWVLVHTRFCLCPPIVCFLSSV